MKFGPKLVLGGGELFALGDEALVGLKTMLSLLITVGFYIPLFEP